MTPALADGETRRVRAYNVRVGDVLSFYDAKKHAERRMIVATTSLRDRPGLSPVVVLTLTVLGARRKQTYVQWLQRHSLVRVRRVESPP